MAAVSLFSRVGRRFPGTSLPSALVLMAIGTATLAKLVLASTTLGTNDVGYWTAFAKGVADFGPIGIYGKPFPAPYNHGPLAGWMLVAINHAVEAGVGFPFAIRVPATLADGVTCWLVYRLLSERTSPTVAAIAAAGVVWSPVLVVISGFHGNTDPVFIALVLSSFWLLTRRDQPLWAGVCIGLAVSVKLVPVVVMPWLLVLALRRSRSILVRFLLGGGIVFAILWVPVMLTAWPEFRDNVLNYRGIWLREWGVAQFIEWAGYPQVDVWLADHGALFALVAALVPFLGLAVGGAQVEERGLGMALVTLLLLSPAFSMQYLAWVLAAAYLVSIVGGWLYNVAASVLVLAVYSSWSGGGPPWQWEQAWGHPFTGPQFGLMVVTWSSLLFVWLAGLVAPRGASATTGAAGPHEVTAT